MTLKLKFHGSDIDSRGFLNTDQHVSLTGPVLGKLPLAEQALEVHDTQVDGLVVYFEGTLGVETTEMFTTYWTCDHWSV